MSSELGMQLALAICGMNMTVWEEQEVLIFA
jgi:hypothetical protein